MDFNKNRVDLSQESEGIWVALDDHTRIKIARYLNPKHKIYLQKQLEPFKRTMRMGTLPEDTAQRIENDALAKFVLLDWEGLKDNGVEVPYSQEKAIEYLSDPTLSWFADLVRDVASDLANFKQELHEEARVNVKKQSNGK